jgi:hypothetical protein
VERLLLLPLPDQDPDNELTKVDLYAQRTTANEISVKTDAGFGGALSALERIALTGNERTDATAGHPDFEDATSAPTRAATLLDLDPTKLATQAELSRTDIKAPKDRTLVLPSRGGLQSTVSNVSAGGGAPMSEIQPIWIESGPSSMFSGPRVWIVGAMVIMAMTAGVAGGMFIASTHEQQLVVNRAALEKAAPAQTPPAEPSTVRASAPVAAPAAETTGAVAEDEDDETAADAEGDTRDPSDDPQKGAKKKKRAPRASKDPNETQGALRPTSATAANAGDESAVAAKAKALESRAAALKPALSADAEKSARLQKLLLDLSFVRASKNNERALEQLRTIEHELDELGK